MDNNQNNHAMEDASQVVSSSSDDDVKQEKTSTYQDFSRLPPLEHMRNGGMNGPAKEPTFPVKLQWVLLWGE